MEEEINKFTTVEILIGTFFAFGIDCLSVLFDITGVGIVVAPVIQGFATFVLSRWFARKGNPSALKFGKLLFKYALNLLPITPIIVTAFTTSIPFVIEVFIHNHPRLAKKAGELAGSAAGGALAGPLGAKVGGFVGGALVEKESQVET
jgi:hypothetical protein